MRIALWATFLVTVILASLFDAGDFDLWWHLKTGDLFLETGSTFPTDPFSHTFGGAPWRYKEILGEAAFALAFRFGGIAGVIVFKSLVTAAAFALLARLMARRDCGGDPGVDRESRPAPSAVVVVGAMTLALFASVFRLTERPDIFMFLGFAASLSLLESHVSTRSIRPLVGYVVVAVVWSNLHRSALLAAAVVAFYTLFAALPRIAGDLRESRLSLALTTVLTALSLMANPGGLAIYSSGGGLVAGMFGADLPYSEWQPPTLVALARDFPAAALVAALAIAGAIRSYHSVGPRVILLFSFFVAAALFSARFVPLAALAGAWVIVRAFADIRVPRIASLAVILLLLVADVRLLTARSPFPGARQVGVSTRDPWFPEGAAAFLDATRPPGKLFHAFHFGGYLAWRLHGVYANFIDGRSDTVFPVDFIRAVGRAAQDDATFERLTTKHGATIALVDWSNRRPDFQHIASSREWALTYWDDISAVYVRRTPATASWLKEHAFEALTVLDPPRQVVTADDATLAALRRDAERNVAQAPQSARALMVRAMVYRRVGGDLTKRAAADEAAARAILEARGLGD